MRSNQAFYPLSYPVAFFIKQEITVPLLATKSVLMQFNAEMLQTLTALI